MGYSGKHISIKNAKDWYNNAASEYHKYHKLLDNFDQWVFRKFFPRNKETINIIDLWAGDGRLYKHLNTLPHNRYVACDIAEKMLKRHPWTSKVEKTVCDFKEPLPFENDSFDLATSFFVLEHLENLENIFSETQRILTEHWRWIIGHFLQRREFIRKTKNESFKIEFHNHRKEDIEKIGKRYFWTIDIFPVKEKDDIIWYIIILEK